MAADQPPDLASKVEVRTFWPERESNHRDRELTHLGPHQIVRRMDHGSIRAQDALAGLSTPEASSDESGPASADAPDSLDAAFGRQLDSWLSWYRIAMAASGLVLTGLL